MILPNYMHWVHAPLWLPAWLLPWERSFLLSTAVSLRAGDYVSLMQHVDGSKLPEEQKLELQKTLGQVASSNGQLSVANKLVKEPQSMPNVPAYLTESWLGCAWWLGQSKAQAVWDDFPERRQQEGLHCFVGAILAMAWPQDAWPRDNLQDGTSVHLLVQCKQLEKPSSTCLEIPKPAHWDGGAMGGWSLWLQWKASAEGFAPASRAQELCAVRQGGNMCNTQAYEKGLLEEVTCEHFATWVQPGTFESKVSLVKAHNATKKLRAFLEAENIISSGQTCVTSFACKLSSGAMPSKKDVVLHQPVLGSTLPFSAGEVQLFVQLDNTILALLEPLGFLSSCQRTRSVQWRSPKEGLYMLPAEAILAPVMWTASKAGVVTTLLPPHIVLWLEKKHARAFWLAGCSGNMELQAI